jgi:hypothetical protein
MRRDVPHGALPNVEWDASLIGQRARVLVGEHEWAEAIITASVRESHSKRTCTLVLEDGCVSQRVLPDHRVVLHIEAALDSSVGAAVADGDGPGEDAAEASAASTCPLGHRLVLGTAEGDGVSCDGCGAPIDAADGINMYGCSACDYDLCAACADGLRGGNETDVDCGGGLADPIANGSDPRAQLAFLTARFPRVNVRAAVDDVGGAIAVAFILLACTYCDGPTLSGCRRGAAGPVGFVPV